MKQSENPVINANSLFDLIKFFHSNLKSKFSSTYFHSQIGDSPLPPPPPPVIAKIYTFTAFQLINESYRSYMGKNLS